MFEYERVVPLNENCCIHSAPQNARLPPITECPNTPTTVGKVRSTRASTAAFGFLLTSRKLSHAPVASASSVIGTILSRFDIAVYPSVSFSLTAGGPVATRARRHRLTASRRSELNG